MYFGNERSCIYVGELIMIARLWANQIIDGNKTIDDVPSKLWDAVEQILNEGYED